MILKVNPDFCAESKVYVNKTNVKIYNLISFLVCILLRMEKRSVRTFDKYICDISTAKVFTWIFLLIFVNIIIYII